MSIAIPSGVSLIGDRAFSGCSGLMSIEVECDNPVYGSIDGVLYSKAQTELIKCPEGKTGVVTIPSSVTQIGGLAFSSCSRLMSIDVEGDNLIYSSVDGMLCNKTQTTLIRCPGGLSGSVTIPSSVTSVGVSSFSGCSGVTSIGVERDNPVYCSVDGMLYNKEQTELVRCPGGKVGVVSVPEGVANIGDCAFSGCSGLTSVSIPGSVAIVGDDAFYGCAGLTSVTIPDGVSCIGSGAFYDCSGLTTVTIPTSVLCIGSGVFSGCSGLTTATIPGSVTNVGESAFSGCSGMTSLAISDGVSCIGSDAFSGCSGLTTVTIPGSVVTVGNYAFSGCSGLTSLTISDGVTCIGNCAFYGCSGLTTVTVPGSVAIVEDNAFHGCTGLTSVTIPDSVESMSRVFPSAYETIREVLVCAGTKSLGDYEFFGCSGMTSVEIPSSVTNIGESAFSNCRGLTSVTIPAGVINIGDHAFSDCSGLNSVTLSDGVANIEAGVFAGCSSLKSVMIPSSVTNIGAAAFSDCSGLTAVTIPTSVVSIGPDAFYGCSSLEVIYVSDVGDLDALKRLLYALYSAGIDVDSIEETPAVPMIAGDAGATVTGDAMNGFVIKPSEGMGNVEVQIPDGVDASKVTVEVSADVKTVVLHGAKIAIKAGANDITGFLDLPDADVMDLEQVKVKDEIVKDALSGEGASVVLDVADPTITTAPTKIGLTYAFREGTTLEGLGAKAPSATKIGDGTQWALPITVKGGNAAFYSISVMK